MISSKLRSMVDMKGIATVKKRNKLLSSRSNL